jgi:hypothetical protein
MTAAWTYMTGFGMYDVHTGRMWNIELARIIQEEREREIVASVRRRQLARPDHLAETPNVPVARTRRVQRPASTSAVSR